jgi:arylsulfatase A
MEVRCCCVLRCSMKHIYSALFLSLLALTPVHARLPNIIFIIADDLGWGDLGCYGQKVIQTPNLDRMAAEGMRFTQHYSGNAVCAPSRCVLMSGKHPGHADIRDNKQFRAKVAPVKGIPEHEGQYPLRSDTVILPMVLKSLGYTTGGFGKWGLGAPDTDAAPMKRGFDRWFGYNCQSVAHNFYPAYLWDNEQRIPLKNPLISGHDQFQPGEDPTKPESYQRFQGTEYSADLISEQALAFAKANKDKPFYLYWPTTVPHLALQVPDDSLGQYVGKFEDPPYAGGRGYLPHFSPRAAYAAMISRMDRDIGRMMDLIKELGLEEDTIFAFTSDNGPLSGPHEGLAGTDAKFFNSNANRRGGKGSLYEAGVRVPCILRWKSKVAAGGVSDRVTGFEDWMTTLLELAGAKDLTPAGTDGVSFAPTLLGQKQPERDYLYREFPSYGGQQSLRQGKWKLIKQNLLPKGKGAKKGVSTELYDLSADPYETKDVAEQHPEVTTKLSALLSQQHKASAEFPFPALDH